jgi:hypothetical protein
MNIIKFTPASKNEKDLILSPEYAVDHLPVWYKKLGRFQTSNNVMDLNPVNDRGTDGSAGSTKICMPFFDAMTSGYMYVLDYDITVSLDEDGFPTLSWEGEHMVLDKRHMGDVAVPFQHHPLHFGWKTNWYTELPKGYSILITHPLNRHDLPFTTLSGIIDADKWFTPVFISFFLKRNFMGVIPKGTPLFQMIPIKRESWEMEIDNSKEGFEKNKIEEERRRTSIYAYYKDKIWNKKNYKG